MLNNDYALFFLRGERPVIDRKYDIMKHPNVKLSADGDAPPYIHGGVKYATASITMAAQPVHLQGAEKKAALAGATSFYTIQSDDELFQISKEDLHEKQ